LISEFSQGSIWPDRQSAAAVFLRRRQRASPPGRSKTEHTGRLYPEHVAGFNRNARPTSSAYAIGRLVAMKPDKRRALGKTWLDRLYEKIERLKAPVRTRGEHAFRVVKRQFGYVRVRCRGLAKNGRSCTCCLRCEHMDGAPQVARYGIRFIRSTRL
jgi:hypothetical protein